MQKGPRASTNVLISRKAKSINQLVGKGYHRIPSYILSQCVIVEDFMRHPALSVTNNSPRLAQ